MDLEKPVHAVPNSDTDILINLLCPPPISFADVNKEMEVSVEVPLHARYGVPISGESFSGRTGNYHDIVLGFPEAFMAYSTYDGPWSERVQSGSCSSHFYSYFFKGSPLAEQAQGSSTPPPYLSEAQLHQVGLAPKSTRFVPIPLSSSAGPHQIRIPVGSWGDLFVVQCGTALVILVSSAWVLFTATRTAIRLSSEGRSVHRKID